MGKALLEAANFLSKAQKINLFCFMSKGNTFKACRRFNFKTIKSY